MSLSETDRSGVHVDVDVRRAVDGSTADELRKALSHLYDGAAVELSREGRRVSVTIADGESGESLSRVVEHFLRGHREVPTVIVHDRRPDGPAADGRDHASPAYDDRIATSSGAYLQGERWLGDLSAVRSFVHERLVARFGAPVLQTPALIDERVLVAAGYYASFPHLVNTVHRLKSDYWSGVEVSRLTHDQHDARRAHYEAAGVALTPVTCYHVYAQAADLLARHGTGLFQITGPVFRHEGGNHDATRLAEFSMTEMVGMGTAAEVADHHRRLLECFVELLEDLDIPFYVATASDPFFGADPSLQRAAQLLGAAKYEVRIPLPGSGDLSVGSINRHAGTFVRAFELADLADVEETCCAGIGLERLTYALAAYGRVPRETTAPSSGANPDRVTATRHER